ncbi:hypothetical protein FV218_20265 [Methylobacterium sp. WL69]|nr:hypothetical protein FV218_20265 [Methylobacterium sp. WL69]
MDTAPVLWHVRAHNLYRKSAKLIGVYRFQESADAAVLRLKAQPAFRGHFQGFEASNYPLDKDHWTEDGVSSDVD